MNRLRHKIKNLDRLRKEPLSNEIVDCIKDLTESLPTETNWLTVKKNLMLRLAPADRQLFSRRDEYTKKHQPFNTFENQVRELWRVETGNTLLMPDEKKLDGVDPDLYL